MPFAVDHIMEALTLNSDHRAELDELGWNDRFASAFDLLDDKELQPGRLAADYSTKFLVQLAGATPLATLGSSLRGARMVAVGDWVAVRLTPESTEIRAVLPRQSAITREAPASEPDRGGMATAATMAASKALSFNDTPIFWSTSQPATKTATPSRTSVVRNSTRRIRASSAKTWWRNIE